MTTNTNMPTADELREQIAEHEATIETAEREAGAALLAGKSTSAARKRAEDARAAIVAAHAAIEQLEGAEAQAAEAARQQAASERRAAEYRYAALVAERAEAMLEAQAAAQAAEDALIELRGDPRGRRFRVIASGMRDLDPVSVDLDADVVERVPQVPNPPKPNAPRHIVQIGGERWTIEHARELRALAEQRAAEEERGDGQDFTGQESAKMIAGRAQRLARREENKRLQAEAEAARSAAQQEPGQPRDGAGGDILTEHADVIAAFASQSGHAA